MANFKPQASGYNYYFGQEKLIKTISKPTYAELLSEVKKSLKAGVCDNFHICRSRRGEWGEWFEVWQIICEKPTIIKEGWS